jgi:hypothetical protein
MSSVLPSLLDLILNNEKEMIDNVVHNAPLGNSDHEILEFNFKLGRNENTRSNQQSLRFFKGNYDEINRLLANIDWDLELIFYRQICSKVHQYLLGPVLSPSRCLLITYLSRRKTGKI